MRSVDVDEASFIREAWTHGRQSWSGGLIRSISDGGNLSLSPAHWLPWGPRRTLGGVWLPGDPRSDATTAESGPAALRPCFSCSPKAGSSQAVPCAAPPLIATPAPPFPSETRSATVRQPTNCQERGPSCRRLTQSSKLASSPGCCLRSGGRSGREPAAIKCDRRCRGEISPTITTCLGR
jgi:hypothetical protein